MTDARTVPTPLMDRMAQAVGKAAAQRGSGAPPAEDAASADPELLANAAFACLDEALASGDARSGAFALLVADALITAACAAVDSADVPPALAAHRFAALLEQ